MMTDRQKEVFKIVYRVWNELAPLPPTYEDIVSRNVSVGTVPNLARFIKTFREEGLLYGEDGDRRAIIPTDAGHALYKELT